MPTLHQLLDSAAPGDAITDQALLLQRWTRALGLRSELYAEHRHPALDGRVRPAALFRPGDEPLVIYHHSIGSDLADRLAERGPALLLIYHNVTPPDLVAASDPALAARLRRGQRQLGRLAPRTRLALGDSPFNERALRAAGFADTGVLPIAHDRTAFDLPADEALAAQLAGLRPLLLFVGRVVPSKDQAGLVKLLFYLRRRHPGAHLALVGRVQDAVYTRWLRALIGDLGLEAAVTLAGHVSQSALATYYRAADLYVSMSDHEGFGKPLVEAMSSGLPLLAYAAGAVPDTVGRGGILFHDKRWPALAEVAAICLEDEELRARLVTNGRARAAAFDAARVQARWQEILAHLQTTAPATTAENGRERPSER